MKNMRELINLMEGIMAVPGINEKSTSEKQARFMAAAAHNPAFAKKAGIEQSVAKEFNDADTGTKQLSNAMKEEDESDMQTAGTVGRNQDYAEFDSEQGMATESVPAVLSCNQDNPENADAACAMEDVDSETCQNAKSRFWEMVSAFVEPDVALNRVEEELREMGVSEEEIQEIGSDLLDEYGVDESMGSHDMSDDADALASAGHDSDEDYGGNYGDEGPDEVYEARPGDIDTDEVRAIASLPHEAAKARAQEILAASRTGDNKKSYLARQIDISRSTMAVVKLLYDMILKGEGHGVQGSSYSKKFDNAVEEAFNLQNGYDEEHDAKGIDYFPTGADGPVVDKTGASGARQGDNPEQKKMQVTEVHKELVYSYRAFLKESDQKKS